MWLRKLFFWRKRKPSPPIRVTMMTRKGCHLCEDAWELLEQQIEPGMQLEKVDIETSPELVAEHGEKIPVILINGKVRFWGRINPVMLKRALRAEARKGEP